VSEKDELIFAAVISSGFRVIFKTLADYPDDPGCERDLELHLFSADHHGCHCQRTSNGFIVEQGDRFIFLFQCQCIK